jgi:hypothetical protein
MQDLKYTILQLTAWTLFVCSMFAPLFVCWLTVKYSVALLFVHKSAWHVYLGIFGLLISPVSLLFIKPGMNKAWQLVLHAESLLTRKRFKGIRR